jgi:NAD+ synthase
MLLGYGTLHGDAAWSLNPLADLYKTDVRLLSKHLGVPQEILDKAPTADLWENQTDEDELGFSYAEMDKALLKIVDEKKSRNEALAEGADPLLLNRVVQLIRGFSYKRRLPSMCWLNEPYSTAHIEDPHW